MCCSGVMHLFSDWAPVACFEHEYGLDLRVHFTKLVNFYFEWSGLSFLYSTYNYIHFESFDMKSPVLFGRSFAYPTYKYT